jgi:hypothetical protein
MLLDLLIIHLILQYFINITGYIIYILYIFYYNTKLIFVFILFFYIKIQVFFKK